jgi:predicted signal transduction protein with EAL and GGDEF domain
MGIVFGGPQYRSGDALLRDADTAMYRSKAAGAGAWCVYDADRRAETVRQVSVEHDLRLALERDELIVFFQPITDLRDDRVRRVEALVRWQHPTRGLLAPADFIDVAETCGLIGALGGVVLEKATAAAAASPGLSVSVNVSPDQLAGGALVEQVRAALAGSGLPPERLCVEITETGLLDDLAAAADVLRRIRSLGVEVAIDDFGTGWSSLSWLQMLPIDEVKVDRSFVARLTDDPVSAAIVRALADLSRSMAIRVVAEGVETAEQLESIARFGIGHVQGFLFGRPRPATDVVAEANAGAAISAR